MRNEEKRLALRVSPWKLAALAIQFISPMLLLPSKVIPRGEQWLYELKFDGFRGILR